MITVNITWNNYKSVTITTVVVTCLSLFSTHFSIQTQAYNLLPFAEEGPSGHPYP